MTYKEKAVEIIMDKLQVKNKWEAIDIVDGISEYGEYKPCVLGVLNAPEDVEDWNQEVK